jgi:hypothetical protein
LRRNNFLATFPLTLLFTVLGFGVMGYHPGAEDDGVYLAAVKADLHPTLYPHDSDFFRLQLQATKFDGWMAKFVDATRMSVPWATLLWQLISVFLILWACRSIAAQLFPERRAQWAGVALVSAMLTLPVAGTALTIVDQYLHPRSLATALILMAVLSILANKRWQAAVLLILSLLLHPIMGALGVSFCVFLVLSLKKTPIVPLGTASKVSIGLMPMGWIFEPPSTTWREALNTRSYYFLSRWAWYEWLGALAPLFLFWLLWRIATRRGETRLARFALAVFAYGVFQQIVAMVVLGPQALVRLTPFQPMRYLHLVYVFLCLVGGGLLGRHLLKAQVWRWAVFLVVVNGGMFVAQRELFPASPHLELPYVHSTNPWLQAFEWIRQNTPEDAYFALDPNYMAAPGEDYHSFRALAERSVLSDAVKDAAVVTQVPELGPVWHQQQLAAAGWPHFEFSDFERLKKQFGVNWVVVSYPPPVGLACPWHNGSVSVCQIP